MRWLPPAVLAVLLALVAPVALVAPAESSAPGGRGTAGTAAGAADEAERPTQARRVPGLRVTRRVVGLSKPWDVQPLGNGRLLITERDTARLIVTTKAGKRRIRFPSGRVWRSGEAGLQGLEVDPDFQRNRRIYTCGGWRTPGGHDIRVIAWRLDKGLRRARMFKVLISGFPTSTGRHSGCRLLIARDGSLVVGTGDAAMGAVPRRLSSLGGKTLRLNRITGAPFPGNPFVGSANRNRRYVQTFGHRNVQGLAQRADGTLWSVEHGSTRDDEVNRLVRGGDYGWHPVPGYNESVPMTDFALPGRQHAARWRSGTPTLATSGATFVRGKKWGAYEGTLAVAALKASRVLFMTFDRSGRLVRVRVPAALRRYGRLRSVTVAANNDLLVTTDAANGQGAVLRVRPLP